MAWAHVAQPVEHFLGKEEVTDSSSVVGLPSLSVLERADKEGQYASSSAGRATDSKSVGRGFDPLLACHLLCRADFASISVSLTGGSR